MPFESGRSWWLRPNRKLVLKLKAGQKNSFQQSYERIGVRLGLAPLQKGIKLLLNSPKLYPLGS